MCASVVAARDRLRRLKEGRYPYREYTYDLVVLGRIGESWEGREDLTGTTAPDEGPVGSSSGSADAAPGTEGSQEDEVNWYLAEEAARGQYIGEEEDPFGFGWDFDGP